MHGLVPPATQIAIEALHDVLQTRTWPELEWRAALDRFPPHWSRTSLLLRFLQLAIYLLLVVFTTPFLILSPFIDEQSNRRQLRQIINSLKAVANSGEEGTALALWYRHIYTGDRKDYVAY